MVTDFAHVGDFCPNEGCLEYGKLQSDQQRNIKKAGKTKRGRQRYRCKTCDRTFTETKGTVFYRRRTPESEIIGTLELIAEGVRVSSLARAKRHKEDTILDWIRVAAQHAETVEEVLLAEYQLDRGQLDALWSYVGNKGEKKGYPETDEKGQFWRATMIDMDTRLRVARGIGKSETQAAVEVFQTLKRRGHPDAPPPTVSDGAGGIREAMVEVYGKVPEYCGRGRPPTKKRPQSGWKYLQVVKKRKNGRVVGTRLRVVYGDEAEVLKLLGKSTAYVERTHLTMRHFNSRLVRKWLSYSKVVEMHKAAVAWEDIVYNLVRPLKTLRLEISNDPVRRWFPQTPAMAAGLTDHIWTVKELLNVVPVPPVGNT